MRFRVEFDGAKIDPRLVAAIGIGYPCIQFRYNKKIATANGPIHSMYCKYVGSVT